MPARADVLARLVRAARRARARPAPRAAGSRWPPTSFSSSTEETRRRALLLDLLVEPVLEVGAQLLQRLPARDALGQLVVERGQLGLLDLVDGDREDRVLAGQLLVVVLGREASLDVLGLAGRHADDPVDEAGDEAVLLDLRLLALGGAALERHAVDLALVVERGDGRPGAPGGRPGPGPRRSWRSCSSAASTSSSVAASGRSGISTPAYGLGLDRRAHRHGRLERGRLAGLALGTRSQAGLASGSMPCSSSAAGYLRVDQVVQRALHDLTAAVLVLEDLPRHFAGPEAGDFRIAGQAAERRVLRGAELFRRDADLELDLSRVERFQRRGHVCERPPEAGTAGKRPPSNRGNWSGRRDLNSRPSPWQGDALPLSYFRARRTFGRPGANPRSLSRRPSASQEQGYRSAGGSGEARTPRRIGRRPNAKDSRERIHVGTPRLELGWVAPLEPKSSASADSATCPRARARTARHTSA